MEEVEEYMKSYMDNCMENTLEQVIKYEFPKISNLRVDCNGETAIIQFDDNGDYTKEEIYNKIEEYKNYKG